MSSDYASLCHDYYLNQRLSLKMDLHMRRDTVLALFDRVRRDRPGMDRFKRYTNELALESSAAADDPSYQWMAVRKTSLRSGSVNHRRDADAHALHRLVLEAAPYFLDISSLDIDHAEVLFGFDLMACGNHDAIVFNALLGASPLATLCDRPGHAPVDCQPIFGVALTDEGDVMAHFEVKTRSGGGGGANGSGGPGGRSRTRGHVHPRPEEDGGEHPISLYLVVRKYGLTGDIRDLPSIYNTLVAHGEELLERRIVPNLLVPIREAIAAT